MELCKLHCEVLDFISKIYKGEILNYTLVQTPYSKDAQDITLEIYVPEKKVAIEINNVYNSSELPLKGKNFSFNRSKICRENDIRMIHIWEHEWFNERQQPILKSIIQSALGLNKRVFARKFKITYKNSVTMKNFFNDNNIQGFRGGEFAICLSDKETEEIYMAYLIGKGTHMSRGYQYEVIRGASKLGYNITGGTTRLMTNLFKERAGISQIVYYIDYNYFDGKSLKKDQRWVFKSEQVSFKNYHVASKLVKNREPQRHAEITRGYKDGSIIQLWNAGTASYVYTRN